MVDSSRGVSPVGLRPFAVGVARRHELADDLRRAEIAHQPLRAGVAEAAGQRAADLRGDADRAAVLGAVGDVDRLRLLPVAEAEQEFAGVVLAGLHRRRLGPADDEALGQLLLQRPGDRGHAGEIGDALVVDPVPELLGAERRLADRRHLGGQLGARQADQVAPPVGELHRRRIEQRRLGEDAVALGRGQIEGGVVHQRAGHALLIAA